MYCNVYYERSVMQILLWWNHVFTQQFKISLCAFSYFRISREKWIRLSHGWLTEAHNDEVELGQFSVWSCHFSGCCISTIPLTAQSLFQSMEHLLCYQEQQAYVWPNPSEMVVFKYNDYKHSSCPSWAGIELDHSYREARTEVSNSILQTAKTSPFPTGNPSCRQPKQKPVL